MNHTLLGMKAGYITAIHFLVLLVFYKLLLHLLEVNFLHIFKSLAKTFKNTAKTKHNVCIIESAVFSNSLPFL